MTTPVMRDHPVGGFGNGDGAVTGAADPHPSKEALLRTIHNLLEGAELTRSKRHNLEKTDGNGRLGPYYSLTNVLILC